MSFYNTNRNENIVEINVVPLVDIVLVILIIFMVSAPVFMKSSINVNLPEASSGIESKQTNINVTINKNGSIDLNGELLGVLQLEDKVLLELKKGVSSHAVISADKDVSHGTVIEVIDHLQHAGLKKFSINVEQNKSEVK